MASKHDLVIEVITERSAAMGGQQIRIALDQDGASTKSHLFSVEKPHGAILYRLNANKFKRLVLGDTDYRKQLLITEMKTVENLRLKLVPFNLEGDYLVHVMLINLREQMIRWCCLDKEENSVVHEVLQNWGQDLLDHYCLDQHTRGVSTAWFVSEGRPFPIFFYIFPECISLNFYFGSQIFLENETRNELWGSAKREGISLNGFFGSQIFLENETRNELWGSANRDYRLQSLKQRMENVKKKILLYDSLDQDYQLQSLIKMMECLEKLILLLDSLDQDDYYRMRRLIGEMENSEKQMRYLDLYHQDAYYRMLRMIKGMENVIIPKLWLTSFCQGFTDFSHDWVIHVAKLHPSTAVRNKDEVHKHKEKTDDDYQCLQLKEALDLQQYCEKDKMKVVDGRIASETRALWNRFRSVVQIDNKLKMQRVRAIYGKDCIKPEQLEGRQQNATRIKRSG